MKNSNVEILNTDRFSCVVIDVKYSKNYKSVIIKEPFSNSYLYFGKIDLNKNININDILYLGVDKINSIDKSTKIILYDKNESILDWTLIYE